ncbi:MAG: hypothetical protein PHR87_09800 [Sulfurospirillaceae bacterium]|nr:hypothetical protein [Sulfurospirillaceae bacterium]
MDIVIIILQVLAFIGISFLAMFKKNYFPKYLEEKAKNTATKEDIEKITSQVESVKQEYKIEFDKIQKNNDVIVSEIKDRTSRYNSKQFELYNDLWSSLIDLKISADELWESASGRKLKDFSAKLHTAKISIEKSSLLIENNHYDELMKIIKEFEEFEIGKKKLINLRNKNIQEIDNIIQETYGIDGIIQNNKNVKNNYNNLLDKLKKKFKSTIRGESSNKTLERNI